MATIVAPALQTNFSTLATDPLRNFKFLVKINFSVPHQHTSASNLAVLGFTSVSGLSVTTESIPYRQGGYNTTVHQIPGQTTFTPITLQRGVLLGTSQPWNWMKMLFSVIAGNGTKTAGENFRAPTVDIQVLQHPVTLDPNGASGGITTNVSMAFRVYNAWITALSYSDLNAGDNALLVEQMTLVHEGFDVSLAGSNKINQSAAAFQY
jgi:phage tail-like protein